MNADERILQIMANSACLSKGQLLGYVKHTLYPEELRVVELHLSSCALCNEALEGIGLMQEADKMLTGMTPPPLPAVAPKEKAREKRETSAAHAAEEKVQPLKPAGRTESAAGASPSQQWMMPRKPGLAKPMGIAAAVVLAAGAFWFFLNRQNDATNEPVLADARIAPADTHAPAASAAPSAPAVPGEDAALALRKKQQHQRDSLLALRKAAAMRADTLTLASRQAAAAKMPAATEKPADMSRTTAETAEVAGEQVAASKPPAAAPPAAKAKQEARSQDEGSREKEKPAASDFDLGMQQYRQKNYASALLYFKSAESDKSDPKHWDAVYYSALCNRNLNKDRRARKLLERIVESGAPQKKAAQKQLDDMEKKDR